MKIAIGSSRTSLHWESADIEWSELIKRFSSTTYTKETMAEYAGMPKDRKTDIKDVGGLVGGELKGTQRKNEFIMNRCILALDIDYGSTDTWDEITTMCDWECLMHTTHSHTPDKPRYRLYFPLSKPCQRDQYAPIGRMVASMLNIELFDDTTYEASRLMFWPSTCKDGEFKVWHQTGEWLNPDDILARYNDWQDESTWPVSSRVTKSVRKSIKDKQSDPRQKNGIVGAFCNVYDIYSAIDKFLIDVYEPTDDRDRYTYIDGTTAKGLKIFDNGLFAQSWHDSDPAHGRLCNAFDLVRIHLFPDADEQKSFDAMRSFLNGDKAVQEKYDEMLFNNGKDMFEDGFDEDELENDQMDLSETGNALRLRDKFKDYMCYNPSLKWCVWNGMVWETNCESLAIRNVMILNDMFKTWAKGICGKTRPEKVDEMKKSEYPPEYQKALKAYAWAEASRNWTHISNTLRSARGVLKDTSTEKFDSDPWDLNTPLGVVNLKTGEVLPHAPWHRCTMMTTVSPDWDRSHERWDAFLDLITCGDKDLQDFLQQIAGMALVGEVYEECLIMCYGSGSNGKSTLFQIWTEIMGSYAGSMRNEIIMGNRFGTEVTGANQLRGKRLVIASELENQQVMSNSLLKRLTSHDAINANVKYAEAITFKPTHTLVIHTNHLPRLKTVDYGTIRRVIIVPFRAKISQEQKRNCFAEELIETEGSAILAWMINGAVRFYQNNMKLEQPEAIKTASQVYLESEDSLNRFISENCVIKDGAKVYVNQLYSAFRNWCEEDGTYWPGGRNKFSQELKDNKGFEVKRNNRGSYFSGICLSDDEEEDDEI